MGTLAIITPELCPLHPRYGALERLAWRWALDLSRQTKVVVVTFEDHRALVPDPDIALPRIFLSADDLPHLSRWGVTHAFIHNRPHWSQMLDVPAITLLHNYRDAWTTNRDPFPLTMVPLDHLYFVSRELGTHYQSEAGFPDSPSIIEDHLLTPFVDEVFFTLPTPPTPPEGRLLFPNRLMVKKGVRETLRALSLSDGTFRVDFVENISPNLAPDADQRQLLADISAHPRAKLVAKADSPEAVGRLYGSYRGIITPSIVPEGFGLVPTEALALGVGVGGAPTGGMTHLINRYATSIDPHDPSAFANVMSELARHPRHPEHIRRQIAEEFSFERSMASVTRALRTISAI